MPTIIIFKKVVIYWGYKNEVNICSENSNSTSIMVKGNEIIFFPSIFLVKNKWIFLLLF